MDEIDEAWPRFVERFCEPDGRLRFARDLIDRDGVDDFYEAFFNWPSFYLLGGSDEILAAAKHHWHGVTAQLTELGMLHGEYENGYDWFHQGESLIFFYALCAADPDDERFRERAQRFAELYADSAHGNYDPHLNIIRAPHNGALGAREGLGSQWQSYPADQASMRPYGLPIEGLPGIDEWNDLGDPDKADLMGAEMQRRANGDVAVNLASTSLVLNAWLYGDRPDLAEWVVRYVDGWRARADANDGLVPDNVGPNGQVGDLQDGRWWGGHYGWNWPHGLPSVGMGVLIGAMNAAFVTGDQTYFDLARAPMDTVIAQGISGTVDSEPMSLSANWMSRLGEDASTTALLVPHRFGSEGWFDHGPMPLDLPTWLWWSSRDGADRMRLRSLTESYPEPAQAVKPFRDKAESGHELPWLAFLDGENPDYPERALSMALGQLARRRALVECEEPDPATVHIHFWQRVQPVVTEVLQQLIGGAPQILYNGGLPFTALSYADLERSRPGLPPDVAALVTALDGDDVEVEIVNTSMVHSRRLRIRPGAFGERDFVSVRSWGEGGGLFPGSPIAYTSSPGAPVVRDTDVSAPRLDLTLPPAHRARLRLTLSGRVRTPRHRTRSDVTAEPLRKDER